MYCYLCCNASITLIGLSALRMLALLHLCQCPAQDSEAVRIAFRVFHLMFAAVVESSLQPWKVRALPINCSWTRDRCYGGVGGPGTQHINQSPCCVTKRKLEKLTARCIFWNKLFFISATLLFAVVKTDSWRTFRYSAYFVSGHDLCDESQSLQLGHSAAWYWTAATSGRTTTCWAQVLCFTNKVTKTEALLSGCTLVCNIYSPQ